MRSGRRCARPTSAPPPRRPTARCAACCWIRRSRRHWWLRRTSFATAAPFAHLPDTDNVRNGFLLFQPLKHAFDHFQITFLYDRHQDAYRLKTQGLPARAILLQKTAARHWEPMDRPKCIWRHSAFTRLLAPSTAGDSTFARSHGLSRAVWAGQPAWRAFRPSSRRGFARTRCKSTKFARRKTCMTLAEKNGVALLQLHMTGESINQCYGRGYE